MRLDTRIGGPDMDGEVQHVVIDVVTPRLRSSVM